MRHFRRAATILGATALAALAVGGASASGPNLLSNGSFDSGASGWSPWGGVPASLAWNAGDHSLSVTNMSAPTITSLASAQQCVATGPGQAYTLSAQAFIPSGQKRHGGAHARLYWYAGPNCTGALLSSPFASSFITQFDTWVTSQDVFVAPASAKSVNVLLGVEQYKADPGEDPNTHFTAKWDNASLSINAVLGDPPLPGTPTATATPPVVIAPPRSTPPAMTPVIGTNPTTTATPTSTPTKQPPTVTSTSTPQQTEQPQVNSTPGAPSATNVPLPPKTGSGAAANGTGSRLFDLFAGALGLVALGGLALATGQLMRRD